MNRRPPRCTRTITLCPFTSLFRSLVRNPEFAALPEAVRTAAPKGSRRITSRLALDDGQDLFLHSVEGLHRAHLRVDRVVELLLRSEEHTSELQSLMRNAYAVF